MTANGAKEQSAELLPDRPILTFNDLDNLAGQLTLEKKALSTLENLSVAEGEIGAGVDVPYLLTEYPGHPLWHKGQAPTEVGITHGCSETEAPMAYQLLIRRGLIVVRPPETHDDQSRIYITPEGYTAIDTVTSGTEPILRQVFFVCRFIPELDTLHEEFVKAVGAEIGCQIQRIKDIPHVDRIDDRICQEIRRSTVILVDLTEQNFNVAFEAGYALALNKPIVWIKRKEPDGLKMPFDIYTYNCLEWDPHNREGFRQDLKFRLLAALQKARS
jgi:hypothetical protein